MNRTSDDEPDRMSRLATEFFFFPIHRLVALTRSKGLTVVLLPTTDGDTRSSLHFFRTMERTDSREVISWSGQPIEFQNE